MISSAQRRGGGLEQCAEVPSVSPGRSPNQLTALAGDDSPTVPPTWFAPALNCSLIIICNWEQTLTFHQTLPTALQCKYNSDQLCPQLLKLLVITIQSGNVGIESKTGEGGKLRKISWFVITNNQKCVQNKGYYYQLPLAIYYVVKVVSKPCQEWSGLLCCICISISIVVTRGCSVSVMTLICLTALSTDYPASGHNVPPPHLVMSHFSFMCKWESLCSFTTRGNQTKL